jgi:hypothetical protein
MMTRHFNTAGPCQSDIHYMLSSLTRLPQLQQFIAQRNYFVIHAPRQIGKTTAIMSLALLKWVRPLVKILLLPKKQFWVLGKIQFPSDSLRIHSLRSGLLLVRDKEFEQLYKLGHSLAPNHWLFLLMK